MASGERGSFDFTTAVVVIFLIVAGIGVVAVSFFMGKGGFRGDETVPGLSVSDVKGDSSRLPADLSQGAFKEPGVSSIDMLGEANVDFFPKPRPKEEPETAVKKKSPPPKPGKKVKKRPPAKKLVLDGKTFFGRRGALDTKIAPGFGTGSGSFRPFGEEGDSLDPGGSRGSRGLPPGMDVEALQKGLLDVQRQAGSQNRQTGDVPGLIGGKQGCTTCQ